MKRDIVLEFEYAAPIELVWRAITDSAVIKEWLMENDFRPVVGAHCQFRMKPQPGFSGIVNCEILEVREPEHLMYTWDGGGSWGKTVLTWTLEASGAHTKLKLEHRGFQGFRPFVLSMMMGSGWKGKLSQKIPAILARLSEEAKTV